jgi:NADPH:quinone reductase-like Zn-dependent oxidoreductase
MRGARVLIETEAWLLDQGAAGTREPGRLRLDRFSFPDITDEEVLAEPIFGCWEANMSHALRRHPVDVCRLRCEKQIVLGNSGVVRIVEVGARVTSVRAGDRCVVMPLGSTDRFGYMLRVVGYDAPGTIGLLARRVKLHQQQVLPLSRDTRHDLRRWAACSVRYATAWDNWHLALGAYRLQISVEEDPSPHVWGWGGGVALGELLLAKEAGCRVAMLASTDARLRLIASLGITAIDRREFADLAFSETRFDSDPDYRERYLRSERAFLKTVHRVTAGERVAIFIDNIGAPVFRATLKALGRQGVVTTAGWDAGDRLSVGRIDECIGRHIHVHSHGARRSRGIEALEYSERTAWLPPVDDRVYHWEEIPRLADDFAAGRVDSYFPIFAVNPP